MGAPAATLAALEVAVRGRGAALARLEPVGVHGQAHRAALDAPFEAGLEEDLVETLLLGLGLHQARAPRPARPSPTRPGRPCGRGRSRRRPAGPRCGCGCTSR